MPFQVTHKLNNMTDPDQNSNIKTYAMEYSLDDDRFFRRGCASCGLHFKLPTDPSALSTLLAPIFAETLGDSSVSTTSDPDTDTLSQLTCPYCGYTDAQQEMHTDDFFAYLHRWISRHFIQPSMRNMFSGLAGSFTGNEFIQISYESAPISVQPIAGPELADMTKVQLLCCDKTMKIMSHWLDLMYCPFCARKTVLR